MDFATLKLGADTSALKKAEKALDDVAATATGTASKVDAANDKMDASFDQVGASAKHAAGSVSAFEKAVHAAGSRIPVANDNIAGMGGSSKLASHQVQNLAFQFQDLGVQLAGGANPLTAFIQQGSQISGIMMQAGMGVGEFAKQIALLAARLTAAIALNPYVLALAAAASTVFVAFKDFQSEVGKTGELEKFQAGLGLTRKELKKLEEDVGPAAITMGDAFSGLGKTISDALNLGPAFDAFKEGFFAIFRFVAEMGSDVAAGIYAAFVGTYRGIIETYKMLPAALGDVLTQAVNAMSRGLETFLNGFIASTNTLLGKFKLPMIDLVVDIPELQNRYAGAANAAGTAFTGQIKQAFKDAKDGFSAAGDTLSANIIDAAKERMQAGADTIIDERNLSEKAKKAGKTLGEYIAIETGQTMTALEKSFKFDDSVMQDAGKKLEKLAETGSAAFRASMQDNLKTFGDVISDIGDLFGGKLGGSFGKFGDLMKTFMPDFSATLGSAFKGLGKSIDKVLAGLGTSLGALGQQASFGAGVGSLIGGGGKNSQIGGAIGSVAGKAIGKTIGALGKFGGPIGQIAGSILGSVLGGLIKGKNPYADVSLSATGAGTIFAQRGGDQSTGAGRALGGAFSNELNLIAKALGGTVNAGTNFGSIGFSGEQYYFNAQGGDFKGAGAQRFGSAEEAVAAAIRSAVDKGAFEGLSQTSKNILASVTEVNADAVVKAVERLNEARGKLVEAYEREADALTGTLERLQGFTANLESFRASLAEQLMTAEEIYQAARGRFEEISKAAIAGNEDAISQLVGVSQNYLSAAQNFLSPEEYNREIENVMRAVDLAIVQTKTMEQYAQGQLDALNASVEGLLAVDQSVVTVREAIDNLRGVMESFERNATSPAGSLYPQSGAYDDFGPMGTFDVGDPASYMSYTVAADEATRDELVKQNEYLRELVRISAKQERTLQEIQIQGEVVA